MASIPWSECEASCFPKPKRTGPVAWRAWLSAYLALAEWASELGSLWGAWILVSQPHWVTAGSQLCSVAERGAQVLKLNR